MALLLCGCATVLWALLAPDATFRRADGSTRTATAQPRGEALRQALATAADGSDGLKRFCERWQPTLAEATAPSGTFDARLRPHLPNGSNANTALSLIPLFLRLHSLGVPTRLLVHRGMLGALSAMPPALHAALLPLPWSATADLREVLLFLRRVAPEWKTVAGQMPPGTILLLPPVAGAAPETIVARVARSVRVVNASLLVAMELPRDTFETAVAALLTSPLDAEAYPVALRRLPQPSNAVLAQFALGHTAPPWGSLGTAEWLTRVTGAPVSMAAGVPTSVQLACALCTRDRNSSVPPWFAASCASVLARVELAAPVTSHAEPFPDAPMSPASSRVARRLQSPFANEWNTSAWLRVMAIARSIDDAVVAAVAAARDKDASASDNSPAAPQFPFVANLRVKTIHYFCRKSGSCGGLADRLKGIASVLALAAHTGRRLRIADVDGVPWAHWFIRTPAFSGLSVAEAATAWHRLQAASRQQRIMALQQAGKPGTEPCEGARTTETLQRVDHHGTDPKLRIDPFFAAPDVRGAECVAVQTNVDWVTVTQSQATIDDQGGQSQAERGHPTSFRGWFQLLLRQHFTLLPALQARYDAFVSAVGPTTELLCVQMRKGDSNFFVDGPRRDAADRWLNARLRVGGNASGPVNATGRKLLVLTDDTGLRDAYQKAFADVWVALPGQVVHMDKAERGAVAVHGEKAVLDFWAVRRCDTVLLNAGSGFVRTALHPNARRAHVYALHGDARIDDEGPLPVP